VRWLIWPRLYGKSHRVVEWWLEKPGTRVIVTANETLARHRRREITEQHPELRQQAHARIMSWRSWSRAGRGMPKSQVALDDCVKMILQQFTGPVHELAVISDAGRVEEPDPVMKARAEAFHEQMRLQYGVEEENYL
jgi:hypothetical protein